MLMPVSPADRRGILFESHAASGDPLPSEKVVLMDHDPGARLDLPGLLAEPASADTTSWPIFGAIPPFRHQAQPDEPEYLHDL
ncbi:MAG: hypothetical protein ACRECL_02975 [Bradyrhizobium sp.]